MFAMEKAVFSTVFTVSFILCLTQVNGQTYCTLKFPARDSSVCDASGTLEENVNSDVYETKGNIEVMQGYQQETFTIFDQQVSAVFKETQTTEADVAGIEEEVTALKQILTDFQNGAIPTTTPGPMVRSKRALGSGTRPSSPAQLALNSASTLFKQNVSDVLLRLQNISNQLDNEAKVSATQHAAMLQDVSNNRQDLTVVENLIKTLDTNIRQLSSQNTKGQGANLTAVTQAYTQLVIDASVAEQIAQRQFDYDEKLLKTMESEELSLDAEILALNTTLTQADLDLTNETNQISTLQGAEKFNENQVEQFINTTTAGLNTWTAALNAADITSGTVGKQFLNATLDRNQLSTDLTDARRQVDGVQSLVSFTKKAQQTQLGTLLAIKRDVVDDLNVLKYAFGIISQVP